MTTRLCAISILLLFGAAACSVPNQSPMTAIGSGAAKDTTLPKFTVFTAGTTPGLPITAVPRDIAAGPDGTIWFTDLTTPAIGSISPKLVITEYTVGLRNGAQPYAIVAGPDGNMWFSDAAAIGRITPAGKIVEFHSGIPKGVSPGGLAVGGGGKAIWSIGVGTPSVLLRVSLDGVISTFPIPPRLSPDGSIAADAAGNVWFFASRPNHNVILVQRTKGGGIVLNRTGLVTKGEPCCPNIAANHIAIGSDGSPWFTTPYFGVASSFYKMVGTFANGKTTLYRTVTGKLTYQVFPSGITSPGGSLWFSGSNPLSFDGALWRLTTNGKQVAYPIPYDPAGLTATSESVVWFTSQAQGRAPQIVRAVF
jgi:streptogramin lyase